MKQRVTYLYNNTYNQGCCRVCRRVCEKPCKVKITTDSSGNITNFRVNRQKINIIDSEQNNKKIIYNGRALRNNEYVLINVNNVDLGQIIMISTKFVYLFYSNISGNVSGKQNIKKLKCALSKLWVTDGENQIYKGTLIRNNKIIKKNGIIVIS